MRLQLIEVLFHSRVFLSRSLQCRIYSSNISIYLCLLCFESGKIGINSKSFLRLNLCRYQIQFLFCLFLYCLLLCKHIGEFFLLFNYALIHHRIRLHQFFFIDFACQRHKHFTAVINLIGHKDVDIRQYEPFIERTKFFKFGVEIFL